MTRDLTTAEQDDGREDDAENPLRAPALRMPPRKPSGRNLTDAERAKKGWGRITLRLPAETIVLLGILADENKMKRAAYLCELIERADREHAEQACIGQPSPVLTMVLTRKQRRP